MSDTAPPQAPDPPGASRIDFRLGVLVAMLAATVAIVDVFASRVGAAQLLDVEEKVAAYQWYNAKALKETVSEGRAATLRALLDGGAFASDREGAIRAGIAEATADAQRYGAEKKAILEGGSIDGRAIVGARTRELRAVHGNDVGDVLDVAKLLLNLGLLLGGVGVAVAHRALERVLLRLVIGLGVAGIGLALIGAALWSRMPPLPSG